MEEGNFRCSVCGFVVNDNITVTCYDKDGKLVEERCRRCYFAKKRRDFVETGDITSQLMIEATLYSISEKRELKRFKDDIYEKILVSMEEISKKADIFREQVWNNGLGKTYKDSSVFMEVAKDQYELRIGSSAGRLLLSFVDKETEEYISLISEEKDVLDYLNIQGISTSETKAIEMIDCFIVAFKQKQPLEFRHNSSLYII